MVDVVTAVRLGVDGVAELVELDGVPGAGVGAALRAALDCRFFEVVRLGSGVDMWIDEEGLCVADPVVNVAATRIARAHGFCWQPYVGTVVFASVDGDGETQGLSGEQVSLLELWVSGEGCFV